MSHSKYALVELSQLTQEMLTYSTTKNPYELKISGYDSLGKRYAVLRFENDVPLILFSLGIPVLKESEWVAVEESEDIWNTESSAPPAIDSAISFNGISKHLNFGNTFQYDTQTAMTNSIWINPANLSADRCIWSNMDAAADGVALYIYTPGTIYAQWRVTNTLRAWTFPTSITPNTEHCLTLTYNGSGKTDGYKLYWNDEPVMAVPLTTLAGSWNLGQDFLIGRRGSSFHFTGTMRQFASWNRELTAEEAASIYSNGPTYNIKNSTLSSGLVAYCPLGSGDEYPVVRDTVGSNHGSMENMTVEDIVTL